MWPADGGAARCVAMRQGCTFVNQYVVIKTLGQGAYGKVKLCLNAGDHNLYALKLVSKVGGRCASPTRGPRTRMCMMATLAGVAQVVQSGVLLGCCHDQTGGCVQ